MRAIRHLRTNREWIAWAVQLQTSFRLPGTKYSRVYGARRFSENAVKNAGRAACLEGGEIGHGHRASHSSPLRPPDPAWFPWLRAGSGLVAASRFYCRSISANISRCVVRPVMRKWPCSWRYSGRWPRRRPAFREPWGTTPAGRGLNRQRPPPRRAVFNTTQHLLGHVRSHPIDANADERSDHSQCRDRQVRSASDCTGSPGFTPAHPRFSVSKIGGDFPDQGSPAKPIACRPERFEAHANLAPCEKTVALITSGRKLSLQAKRFKAVDELIDCGYTDQRQRDAGRPRAHSAAAI